MRGFWVLGGVILGVLDGVFLGVLDGWFCFCFSLGEYLHHYLTIYLNNWILSSVLLHYKPIFHKKLSLGKLSYIV